jgi:hypothetical protein
MTDLALTVEGRFTGEAIIIISVIRCFNPLLHCTFMFRNTRNKQVALCA